MDEIRVCNPFEFKQVFEFDGKHITGAAAEVFLRLIEYISNGNNFTIVVRSKSDGIGELNPTTGLYDGCIGRLQRNQSDFLAQLVDYPLDVDHTKQGDIGMSAKIQYIGIYEPRSMDEANSVKIESCFKSFNIHVWVTCFVTFLLTYLLIIIRSKVRSEMRMMIKYETKKLKINTANHFIRAKFRINYSQKLIYQRIHKRNQLRLKNNSKFGRARARTFNNYFLSNILSHMFRIGSLNKTNGPFNKIIYISMSIFSLIVVHYFCSFIKTELVSIPPPKLLKSYKEMVDNDVDIIFIDGFSHYRDFKFAPFGSYERTLWEKTLVNYPYPFWSIEQGFETIKGYIERASRGKLVYVLDSFFARWINSQICSHTLDRAYFSSVASVMNFSLANEVIAPYFSSDPYEKSTLKGMLYSSGFNGHKYIHIRVRLERFLETGLAVKTVSDMESMNIFKEYRTSAPKDESRMIRICKSGAILSPEVHLAGIQFDNIKNCMICVLSLWAFSLFVFFCELSLGHMAH